MNYPPPPWILQGYSIQTIHLIDVERAANFVPPELEIISLLPGKTLGGIYLSSYEEESLLRYNELIVVPALVHDQGTVGAWISHIYVDNQDSISGGREIWGLPKEMAKFTWQKESVRVSQEQRELCFLSYIHGLSGWSTWWKVGLNLNIFSGLGNKLLLFKSEFSSRIGLVKANLEMPDVSPFANLNFVQPWLTLNLQDLNLVVDAPKVIGNKTTNLTYV